MTGAGDGGRVTGAGTTNVTGGALVAAARSYVGVPFRHAGRSMRGVDCIGMLLCAGTDAGLTLPEDVNYSRIVDTDRLRRQVEEVCDLIWQSRQRPRQGPRQGQPGSGQPGPWQPGSERQIPGSGVDQTPAAFVGATGETMTPLLDVRSGDVLLFEVVRSAQHMGMYTGEGFLHAYQGVGYVVETPLEGKWLRRLVAVYRVRGLSSRKPSGPGAADEGSPPCS